MFVWLIYVQWGDCLHSTHFGCGPAALWLSISGSSNVAKVTAIECMKHLRSEAHWRSSLSKASRTTVHASPKINADQQKWIKIPKEPKNRRLIAGPIELKRAWHWIGVDGTKAPQKWWQHRHKSHNPVAVAVVAKGDGEGTDDDAKMTKISKCTAPKETKT